MWTPRPCLKVATATRARPATRTWACPVLDPNEADKRHEEILKAGLPAQDLADLIRQLSEQMHTAAEQLQFELAARLRDEIRDLKKELRQMTEANK